MQVQPTVSTRASRPGTATNGMRCNPAGTRCDGRDRLTLLEPCYRAVILLSNALQSTVYRSEPYPPVCVCVRT